MKKITVYRVSSGFWNMPDGVSFTPFFGANAERQESYEIEVPDSWGVYPTNYEDIVVQDDDGIILKPYYVDRRGNAPIKPYILLNQTRSPFASYKPKILP